MTQAGFEQVENIYRTFNKPLQELTALNIRSMNKAYETWNMEELMNAKSTEDLVKVQSKIAKNTSLQAIDYLQRSLEIWGKAANAFTDEVAKNNPINVKPKKD